MNTLIELISWLRIFLSPVLFSIAGAAFIWFNTSSYVLKAFAVLLLLAGVIAGVYFAERVRRKKGTHHFMSEIYRSEDVDKRN